VHETAPEARRRDGHRPWEESRPWTNWSGRWNTSAWRACWLHPNGSTTIAGL